MKIIQSSRTALTGLLFVTSVAAASTQAEPGTPRTETQQALLAGSTFSGLTIAGTLAAGPIGFIAGAIGGAYLADQTRIANERHIALQQTQSQHMQTAAELTEQQRSIEQLQAERLEKMTFQMLFATGEDQLSALDQERVRQLAAFLQRHPKLQVALDGHTDSRGTDEYNNVLAQERALAVKQALVAEGIDPARITHQGHGTRFAVGKTEDERRVERRVDITFDTPQSLAKN